MEQHFIQTFSNFPAEYFLQKCQVCAHLINVWNNKWHVNIPSYKT